MASLMGEVSWTAEVGIQFEMNLQLSENPGKVSQISW